MVLSRLTFTRQFAPFPLPLLLLLLLPFSLSMSASTNCVYKMSAMRSAISKRFHLTRQANPDPLHPPTPPRPPPSFLLFLLFPQTNVKRAQVPPLTPQKHPGSRAYPQYWISKRVTCSIYVCKA
ncbi:hypothetical protein DFP73DRAFT_542481 [Morchella snyderi]|nr:hypothetical protein DFP73DRAFT_542481 [Morchella snyderi]